MFDTFIHKYLRIPYSLHVHVDQAPRRARATVLLLHGIGDSAAAWDEIVSELPDGIRVLSVDLLGFGQSPTPRWLKYDIRVQAQSVVATLLARRIRHPLVIVGHSMGSLTAIEIAKRYPLFVKSLILCSPPLYSDEERKWLMPNQNKLLRRFYRLLVHNPVTVATLSAFVTKLKVLGASFNITRDNVDVFMSALESSIINQTAFRDVQAIEKSISIIHGALDPLVVKRNLTKVVKENPMAELKVIRAGHELGRGYVPAVVAAVEEASQKDPRRNKTVPHQAS